MTEAGVAKYCFDTDTLAASYRRYYRPDTFESLWEKLGEMAAKGVILIPEEVRKEIGVGKDGLNNWMKKHSVKSTPISEAQLKTVEEIVNKYPVVSQYKKPRPNHADPFVVAVAKEYGATVVTFEGKNGSTVNPSVPVLCSEYGVDCCTIADFFEKEKITFEVKVE